MPASIEGPFAEKLKAAAVSRTFPDSLRDPITVTDGLDLSGGGKSRRERRKEKREKYERDQREGEKGEGISGHTVHTRGQFVEPAPAETDPEAAEREAKHNAIVSLVERINATDDRLQKLFEEYPEAQPTITETKDDGSISEVEVRVIASEAFAAAGREVMEYEAADGAGDLESLEKRAGNLSSRLAEMEEAEDCFRESVKLTKIERIHPDKGPGGEAPHNEPNLGRSGENSETQLLFEGKLALLEVRIQDWRGIRQELLDLIGDRQYERFIAEGGPVGALARGKILKEVDARIAEYRQALNEGKKPGKREQAWLERHLQGMDEIIAAGKVIRDQIQSERGAEGKPKDESFPPEKEQQTDAERRSYASFSQAELRDMWRSFSHEEMLGAVERQLADWERFDEEIRKFGDEARLLDDIRRSGTEEDPEEVIRLTGRTGSIRAALGTIRERFEQDGRLSKKDAGTLTALLHPYHELLVAAERIVAEREHETPIIEAEKEARKKKTEPAKEVKTEPVAAPESASIEKDTAFEEKLAQLNGLLERWNTLNGELGESELETALLRLRKGKALPPIKDLEGWLSKKTTPEAWSKQDRKYVEADVLPEMERLIRQAEKAAKRLREASSAAALGPIVSPSPEVGPKRKEPIARGDIWMAPAARERNGTSVGRKVVVTGVVGDGKIEYRFFDVDDLGNAVNMGFGSAADEAAMREWLAEEGFTYDGRQDNDGGSPAASVVTLDRRPVIDGELTDWERMNPVEQNRLRRELFSRKDRFVSGLNDRLKRAGVSDADRRNTIIRYLDEYLPQVIELVVKVPLQATDRESLLKDLKKEIAIT